MRKLVLLIAMIIFSSCSEPFEFATPSNNVVVIDAKVSTIPGNSFAVIYGIKNRIRSNVTDLRVNIISELGTVMEFAFNERKGKYLPLDPSFKGVVGASYRLEAYEGSQLRFISTYDSIQSLFTYEISVSDTVILDASDAGLLVERSALAANASVVSESLGYSKFNFSYSYRHYYTGDTLTVNKESDFVLFSSDGLELGKERKIPVGYEVRETWFFFNPDPICDQVPTFPCGEPCCLESERWVVKYQIKQERLSRSAYEYWSEAQRLLNNDGILFDTFPFPIEGNVTCDKCGDKVIGFFRSVAEETQTLFVNL